MNQIQNKSTVNTTVINDPIMPLYQFTDDINTLCIKATVGIGKTNTLYDFLKYNLYKKYKSCLIVSFRISLCKKYLSDLPSFSYYENINESEFDSSLYPFLICQIDSIKKVRGHYDLIIFDEISYTMNHLVGSVESKKRCFDLFKNIMYDNNHIIIMDALLNEEWVEFVNIFKRNIHYIINEYSIHKNKTIFNYGTNITAFEKEIRKSIEKKENIVIATNNKKMLNFIDNILVNNYPTVNKMFIKRESKSMYDLDQWKNVQVLAYTPTIVAGISFTEKHFDKCFGLFCNSSATADMALQQLFRVRDISSGEYHICCQIKGKRDYPETDEDIKNLILKEDKCLISGLDNITLDYIKKDIHEDEYFKLFNIVQKNKFKCCNNYNKVLIDLLKTQGITNIKNVFDFDIKDKKILSANIREFNKKIRDEDAERTANALDITEEERQTIKENKNKSDEDIFMAKKYDLKKRLKIKEVTKDTILKFGKKGKVLWNLSYINSYTDYKNQLLKRIKYDEIHIDINNDITTRLGRDRKYETLYLCNHMLEYMGFKGPFDNSKIDINKEKFKNYIINYKDIIENYFRCNSFDLNIFNKDITYWYKLAKMYINNKLRTVYNVSIVDDRKNNKWFLSGLDFWNDVVTYKNEEIINEIRDNEVKLFDKIDKEIEEKKQEDAFNDKVDYFISKGMDIFEALAEVVSIKTDNNINDKNISSEDNVIQDHILVQNKPIPKLNALNAFEQWKKNKSIIDNNNVLGDLN